MLYMNTIDYIINKNHRKPYCKRLYDLVRYVLTDSTHPRGRGRVQIGKYWNTV